MVIIVGKPYVKSAKDKAFDRERTKLHAIIQDRDREIVQLHKELDRVKTENATLERTVAALESQIGVPSEKILEYIERHKKMEQYMSFLTLGRI